MLREYGQFERVEGQLIAVPLPDTDQTEKEVLNKMEYHLALSPKITVMKGQTKRVCHAHKTVLIQGEISLP